MRSSGRFLLSRIGQHRQPYSPVALRSASFVRFYTSGSDNPNEERLGVWDVLKNCLGWNKQEVRVIVPEAEAYVIERYGKYIGTLTQGHHSLIPTCDKVAYVHSLKEETISIPDQPAITNDGAQISVDGSLCLKIVDPKLASYAVEKPIESVIALTRSIMRGQIGIMTLDETFEKRDTLNERILMEINDAVKDWGFTCLRYEIRNISLPTHLKEMMERQAIEEHARKASSLVAEAERQATFDIANAKRMSMILAAQAESKAIELNTRATAEKLSEMSKRLKTEEGAKAVTLELAKAYENACRRIILSSYIIRLPEETSKGK